MREEAILKSLELLFVPYIWGGNDPVKDKGVDCSGAIGWVFREIGFLPKGYDNTAQGYYNKWKCFGVITPGPGCLTFYGKKVDTGLRIVHIMLCLTDKVCIGAVRGNRWTTTVSKAKARNAEVQVRKIKYRRDLIAIVDPFKGE